MGFASFLYTLVIYPIRLLLDLVFAFSKHFTDNAGLSIICISLAVSLLCLPLYMRADALQKEERDKQKSLEHWSRIIKKAFSGDEQYFILNEYYRLNHYNPLMVLRSSFGLLIQIPFFIAAYSYISQLEVLKGSRFFLIGDLSAPDGLLKISSFRINILPIAMALINVISGIIYTKDLALKDKLQLHIMTLLFLMLPYNSPSGLVLYWTCNNIFSLLKNILYRIPRPHKFFYMGICITASLFCVWQLFLGKLKAELKFAAIMLTLVLFALPYIIRFARYLLDTKLSSLVMDRNFRLKVYTASCTLLFFLFGLSIPSTLVASSASEFAGLGAHPSPFYYIFTTLSQGAGLLLFWPLCIYMLFRPRIQAALATLMGFLAVSALLNSYIFMPHYGDISSSLNFLNAVDFKSMSAFSGINILVLMALAVLFIFLLSLKKKKLLVPVLSVLCLSMLVVSTANLIAIRKEYKAYAAETDKNKIFKVTPVFHLSKNHENVILIMLDRAQPQYVAEIFKEKPELLKSFAGFTHYKNTVSFNGHTLEGAPPLYGGYEYTPVEMNRRKGESLAQKSNESQLLLPRIFTEELGYTAVVTDPEWGNYNTFCDTSFINEYNPAIKGIQTNGVYSSFWFREKNRGGITDKTGIMLERNLLLFSFFRSSPIALRKAIYNDGHYWSNDAAAKQINTLIDCYSVFDYMKELTDIKESESGFYMSFTSQLTHTSFHLQAPDFIPVDTVTEFGTSCFLYDKPYHTQIAAFSLLAEWFDYLREQGVWDNTKIIMVSDHGCFWNDKDIESDDELDAQIAGGVYTGRGHYHPILFFKDFNSNGAFRVDEDTFMTNADTPSLLLKGLVDHPVNPFTGKEIPLDTTDLKKDGVVISACDNHRPDDNGKYQFSISDDQWWRVRDNIYSPSSWSREPAPNFK